MLGDTGGGGRRGKQTKREGEKPQGQEVVVTGKGKGARHRSRRWQSPGKGESEKGAWCRGKT